MSVRAQGLQCATAIVRTGHEHAGGSHRRQSLDNRVEKREHLVVPGEVVRRDGDGFTVDDQRLEPGVGHDRTAVDAREAGALERAVERFELDGPTEGLLVADPMAFEPGAAVGFDRELRAAEVVHRIVLVARAVADHGLAFFLRAASMSSPSWTRWRSWSDVAGAGTGWPVTGSVITWPRASRAHMSPISEPSV